jgi:hypothetical protein
VTVEDNVFGALHNQAVHLDKLFVIKRPHSVAEIREREVGVFSVNGEV